MKNHYEQIIAGESRLRGPESETKELIKKGTVNTRVSISQMHVCACKIRLGQWIPVAKFITGKPALQPFVSKKAFCTEVILYKL